MAEAELRMQETAMCWNEAGFWRCAVLEVLADPENNPQNHMPKVNIFPVMEMPMT